MQRLPVGRPLAHDFWLSFLFFYFLTYAGGNALDLIAEIISSYGKNVIRDPNINGIGRKIMNTMWP